MKYLLVLVLLVGLSTKSYAQRIVQVPEISITYWSTPIHIPIRSPTLYKSKKSFIKYIVPRVFGVLFVSTWAASTIYNSR